MMKHIAAACLLGTALASAPAYAQSPGASGQNQPAGQQAQSSGAAGQFLTQMSSDQWRGSKLVGVDVYGSDNQKIGDINEVIVDRNGQAKAIVIGVGGFLGIGEKNVAVSWDKVQWNMGGDQSSGGMASGAGAGGQAPADRTTSRDVAQTTTGSSSDPNAQPPQAAGSGGATLSSAPSSGSAGNAPANTAPSATTSTTASGTGGGSATAGATSRNQDYPERALVSMSKQDLQNAPEFRYASDRSSASGSGGSGGSSMTGSTGSTSGR